jgi:glutathione S-transferase
MMLVVHHLGLSQSERVVWLCEELGIEYELKRYDRRADNRLAPDEYKALHPMGIAPVITDGDLVLGESAAICEYIDARYGGGRLSAAPDDADYADYLFWFHWSNATYMATKMIGMGIAYSGGDAAKVPFVTDRARLSQEMMERRLGEVPFFAGDRLTLADIMMVYSLTTSRAFGAPPLGDLPHTQAYLRRIGERPAYQRAMTKAEPGMRPMID